jgi:hypothetical protein
MNIFVVPQWLVQVFRPPHKFVRPPLWNVLSYEIKKYDVEVNFNDLTSLLNFIKSNWFKSYLRGGGVTEAGSMFIWQR